MRSPDAIAHWRQGLIGEDMREATGGSDPEGTPDEGVRPTILELTDQHKVLESRICRVLQVGPEG
jgi:hypothetical protein